MMPWRKDKEQEIETLSQYPKADYIFSHSEIAGINLNGKSIQEHGNDLSIFSKAKRVYSGHIHYGQKKGNMTYIGNPYQMTRSDINNKKGIYYLDLIKDEETFIENNYTPKFLRLNLKKAFNLELKILKKIIKNNFVDFYVDGEVVAKFNISKLLSLIDNIARKIELNIIDEDIINDAEID
jgi:hypothetical protein